VCVRFKIGTKLYGGKNLFSANEMMTLNVSTKTKNDFHGGKNYYEPNIS